jgi:lipopolysaccharide export system permease protein
MKIKDRYIAKTLLTYTLLVLLVWLSIYSFFNFLSELNNVGTKNYTIIAAFQYIFLQIPEVAYDQASAIILLGCILGMGHLASTSQLIIFRAAGISIFKITWLTIKNALFFVIFFIIIGEFFAPYITNYSEVSRSIALGQGNLSKSQDGFWIRDGNNFISVKNNIDGKLFSEISIIEVDSSNRIERLVKSDSAVFDGKYINMKNADIYSVIKDNNFEDISLKTRNLYSKIVAFDNDLINSLEKDPKELPTLTIIKQIQFLSDNRLRSGVFEVELYKRLIQPFTLIAMILLSMLFIFGSTRDATLGRKIFFGISLGLSFELLSRVGGALALSFHLNPLYSSLVPTLSIMLISIFLLTKKSIG